MKNKLTSNKIRLKHLIILLIILNSCSKDNDKLDADNLEFNGSYELTLTGDENRNLIGEANFLQVVTSAASSNSSGASLVLSLTSGNVESLVLTFVQESAEVFSVGNYTYAEEDLDTKTYFSVAFYSSESMLAYLITSGSIELTKVSNTSIEGEIDIVMSNTGDDNIVNISGTFKAVGITQTF